MDKERLQFLGNNTYLKVRKIYDLYECFKVTFEKKIPIKRIKKGKIQKLDSKVSLMNDVKVGQTVVRVNEIDCSELSDDEVESVLKTQFKGKSQLKTVIFVYKIFVSFQLQTKYTIVVKKPDNFLTFW